MTLWFSVCASISVSHPFSVLNYPINGQGRLQPVQANTGRKEACILHRLTDMAGGFFHYLYAVNAYLSFVINDTALNKDAFSEQ